LLDINTLLNERKGEREKEKEVRSRRLVQRWKVTEREREIEIDR
jgi:hypothetical protein